MEGPALSGAVAGALLAAAALLAADDWPQDDFALTESVNEGRLEFIAPSPDAPVLHADTVLVVRASSKRDGWISMRQCYRHLDAVERTDVVYAYREMRALRVTYARNIDSARVEAAGIALDGVGAGAELCVAAEVRILTRWDDGSYRLESGPWHRRFLDGYYPYHVSLTVRYADSGLSLARLTPPATAGFGVTRSDGELAIDAWFTGRLTIGLEFGEAAERLD